MRLSALFAALILAACQPAGEAGPDAPAPAVLTVFSPAASGAAPEAGLFERYGLAGPAEGFTLDALAALEQPELAAAYPPGTGERIFRGPRLSAVLAAAGAPGRSARLTALDGYAIEVSASTIAEHQPILALSANGEPLTLGGLGPVMVIWPETYPGPDDEAGAADWIWSVFAIEVIE
jgi:hypothetical protein